MTPEEYAVKIIADLLEVLKTQSQAVRENKDIEPVHRVRVTCRRLRNAFSLFKNIFPSKKRSLWNKQLSDLGRVFGRARDLDVHLAELSRYEPTLKEKNLKIGVQKIIKQMRAEREGLQPQLVAGLDRLERQEFIPQIEKVLKGISRQEENQDQAQFSGLIKKEVVKRLRKLLAFEPYVRQEGKQKELHQMRIAAKHLRYTLECFEPLYGKRIHPFVRAALSVHRMLGDLHDSVVWAQHLKVYSCGQGEETAGRAVGFLHKRVDARRKRIYRTFVERWLTYRRERVWEKLQTFNFSLRQ